MVITGLSYTLGVPMAARPHAPSAQRIADARASGHVPRAPLLWLAGLLALSAVGAALGPRFGSLLRALWSDLLSGGAVDVWGRLHGLLALLAWSLGAIFVLLLGVVWLVQGPAFAAWSRRAQFEALRPDRTASALWACGLCLLTGFALTDALAGFAAWAWGLALLSLACLLIDAAFARARWFASLWLTRREYVDQQREQAAAPALVAARNRARRGEP